MTLVRKIKYELGRVFKILIEAIIENKFTLCSGSAVSLSLKWQKSFQQCLQELVFVSLGVTKELLNESQRF